MSTSGRVSVVIPCFNAEATLGEAVKSALVQTWRNIEIIVLDDGSSDASAGILRSFGNRIRVEWRPHRGASAARNRGTALASGAYIQYLDADDLLALDAVERRVAALQSTGADVAYGDWQRFSLDAQRARRVGEIVARHMEDIDPDPEIACATSFWAPPAALLYNRRIVEAIAGWNERLPIIQDARFLFDAARHRARFVHVPGVSAFYRDAGRSLSRGNERAFVLDVYRNGIELQSLWEADGRLTLARKNALAGIFDMAARAFFRHDMAEFDDAVARFRQVSERRWGYPEVAHRISRLASPKFARSFVQLGAYVSRGLRRLAGANS